MTAFIVFLLLTAWIVLGWFLAIRLGPRLKAVSDRYPLANAEDKPEAPVKYAHKDSPLYVVSKTFAEADAWRRKHRWHRDNTYWVSGPAGLRTAIPESTVVFTGNWEDRDDAPELWAQAAGGFNRLIDGAPESEVEVDDLDDVLGGDVDLTEYEAE